MSYVVLSWNKTVPGAIKARQLVEKYRTFAQASKFRIKLIDIIMEMKGSDEISILTKWPHCTSTKLRNRLNES